MCGCVRRYVCVGGRDVGVYSICNFTLLITSSPFLTPPPPHTHTHTHMQSKPDYEFNELILYEVQLMMESGRKEEALKHICQFESQICDTLTVYETKGTIQLANEPHPPAC